MGSRLDFANLDELEEFMRYTWSGDCTLTKILDSGMILTMDDMEVTP